MFVPVISNLSQHLYPRKGGGGGGRGGGGSKGGSSGESGSSSGEGSSGEGSTGSTGSTGSSGSSGRTGSSSGSSGSSGPVGSKGATVPVTGSTVGRSSAVSYGQGTTKVISIPAGQPFAGRTSGGATRGQVFGSQQYGSGYPGIAGRGVGGRNFPFVFWPVIWGGSLGYGAAYLHDREYGDPNNSSRPGGALMQAAFSSNSTNSTSVFHVVADNSSLRSLIGSIEANCSIASNSSTSPVAFNGSASDPKPEQAIQYYRASSVVLTLDGYNDTAALTNDTNAPAAPLPSNVDRTLLNCLNQTIGAAVPLFDDSTTSGTNPSLVPNLSLVGLVYVIWCFTHLF
ncbi:hypothetical protein C8Q73DRAFT_195361 [Cubamyces lactineus]|nr:hypothetical protein C8Q73DRAFT_195361 [Cubamyces lactineus]